MYESNKSAGLRKDVISTMILDKLLLFTPLNKIIITQTY
jgi:hypothetical protein